MKLVEKKLLTNTFWPAPTSQTPFVHVKKRESIASGAFSPTPVPVSGTVWGLFAALSVSVKLAERVPAAVGENVIETLQLVPAASVNPEHPSLTSVKSSVFGTAALLMKSDAVPVFAIVIDCGALVAPIAREPNVSDVGVRLTAGALEVDVPPPPPLLPPLLLPPSPAATAGIANAATTANARSAIRACRTPMFVPSLAQPPLRASRRIGFLFRERDRALIGPSRVVLLRVL